MTGNDLIQYLQHPERLSAVPLEALQRLAVRFPYSANVQQLLLLKAHLETHPDESHYLARCAAASFDRAHLYTALKELDRLDRQTSSEVLELRELDEILPEAIVVAPSVNAAAATSSPTPPDLAAAVPEPVTDQPSSPQDDNALGETHESYLVEDPASEDLTKAAEPEKPAPPPSLLTTSATDYGSLRERLHHIRQRQRSKTPDAHERVGTIARKSILTQDEVVSETLAKIFVQQGQFQRAIKVYQRLKLLYPEKKANFADCIKELKQKL